MMANQPAGATRKIDLILGQESSAALDALCANRRTISEAIEACLVSAGKLVSPPQTLEATINLHREARPDQTLDIVTKKNITLVTVSKKNSETSYQTVRRFRVSGTKGIQNITVINESHEREIANYSFLSQDHAIQCLLFSIHDQEIDKIGLFLSE